MAKKPKTVSSPSWLYISGEGGAFHEQMDAHAPKGAADDVRYQHRVRDQVADNHGAWTPGRAPGGWQGEGYLTPQERLNQGV